MSDMPVIDESNSNYVKLPYTLTKGVTATREGLCFDGWLVQLFGDPEWLPFGTNGYIVSWQDAAYSLRYRDGEPWCFYDERNNGLICDTTTPAYHGVPSYLHRLAAILCDDAEAFRVLHWCIHNLPQESNNG